MSRHSLKVIDPFFDQLGNGKGLEIRKNDRDFQVGDYLDLKHYVPGLIENHGFTGRAKEAKVTCVTPLNDVPGLAALLSETARSENYCALSLEFPDYQPYVKIPEPVQSFAKLMADRLKENQTKGPMDNPPYQLEDLRYKIKTNAAALDQEIGTYLTGGWNYRELVRQAADVANLCGFVVLKAEKVDAVETEDD